ncbi:hypothetical protein EJB05_37854, partial [Eragrostis curvula]
MEWRTASGRALSRSIVGMARLLESRAMALPVGIWNRRPRDRGGDKKHDCLGGERACYCLEATGRKLAVFFLVRSPKKFGGEKVNELDRRLLEEVNRNGQYMSSALVDAWRLQAQVRHREHAHGGASRP